MIASIAVFSIRLFFKTYNLQSHAIRLGSGLLDL